MEDRRKKLIGYLCPEGEGEELIVPLIDEMIFLECRLSELRELPFIKVHPSDPLRQKSAPAAKQYKELLQQYINVVKVLEKTLTSDDSEAESPLRQWVRSHAEMESR